LTGSTPTLDLHLTDRPRRASAGFSVAPAEGSRHGVAVASVERLGKRYGRRQAVDGVSFEVNEREVVGLLGPNGSGKTTILRVLTGYLRPSEGTVRIDGFDVVRDGHQARARVGYVPENAPLYDHMRVNEFLQFMGRLRGMRGPALRRGVESARVRLALDPVGDVVIGRLSRGYRQRVSIAQAVLHEPKLLVLDEPTNGLDPRQVIELRGLLQTLAHDSAVLVTSHILAEMERVADRVAILLDGRLLAVHSLAGRGASLRVRARTDRADEVAAVLSGLLGIAGVTREEPGGPLAGWRVEVTEAGAAPHVAAALGLAGVASVETIEAASDLEELFLRLTASRALQ
jgi:ABC-2 type transport system ATP-binding protein